MFKRFWNRVNPFHKTIKIIYNGATIHRHGNCYDIALPYSFYPLYCEDSIDKTNRISLGIQTELPKGYGAVLNFRSSTAGKYGYINVSGFGEVEGNYCGVWHGIIQPHKYSLPAYVGARLFQFKLELLWDAPWYVKVCHLFATFSFVTVKELKTTRGGLGSTGR